MAKTLEAFANGASLLNPHIMTILTKLIIITIFFTAALSGCRVLSPDDQPFPVAESLHQAELAESTATLETASPATTETTPVATAGPAATAAGKTPLTTPEERSVKLRLSYTVSEGELLWTIAKRADVYDDPLLWPLLYQANRDQIKDPRKIYAGQTLTIPRNTSEEEREKARNLAKKSDIFSPE